MKFKKAISLLVFLALGTWVWGCTCSRPCSKAAPVPTATAQPAMPETAKCPVTGEDFKVTKDSPHSVYKGKDYYFCCPPCKAQFDADPEKYLRSK